MARKILLLKNKVARRILVSFVLATLIPVGLLGGLSFREVNEQLRDQTNKSLHKSCKDYAIGLIDRLILIESTLRLVAIKIEKPEKAFAIIH